jgi:hypothetical protein
MSKAESAAKIPRGPGRPFKKGQSGNPAARPIGSRHKTTLAMESLLDGEADTIVRKAIEMAKDGDALANPSLPRANYSTPKGSTDFL